MTDYALALQTKPPSVDVATPLLTAAKIRAADAEQQKNQFEYRQNVIGSEARGLAALADSPDFPKAWGDAHDRMLQQGAISPEAHAQLRNSPSPLILHQLLASTQSPQMALAEKQFAETQKQHGQTFGLEQEKLAELKRQHGIAEEKPVVVSPGSQLVKPNTGHPIFSSDTGLLDKPTIDAMAKQAMSGDTSVFTNLGRGAQGAENVIAVRKRIAELNSGSGESGAEQAQRNAEFFGIKAGQRTLGTRSANIELAATEFKQVLPVVQAASQAVSRSNYPDLNRIVQAFEEKTGDPNVVKFGGGVNTLVNLYARAISPSGNPTVSDKDHARLILNRAWSQGQFDAAVGMMSQEIDAALSSPDKVRDAMRQRFLGGQQGGAKPSTAAPPVNDNPAISDARIAIGKGAPRDKVEQRLKEKGIKFSPSDLDLQ